MKPIFTLILKLFYLSTKNRGKSPGALSLFRIKAMKVICIGGFIVCIANASFAHWVGRLKDIFVLELPIALASVLVYFWVDRSRRAEWVSGLYILMIYGVMSAWILISARSIHNTVFAWFPVLVFVCILLCGRVVGQFIFSLIFLATIALLSIVPRHGFVLPINLSFDNFQRTMDIAYILIALFVAGVAFAVEWSREQAELLNQTATASSLERASLCLLGDMAQDMNQTMRNPLLHLEQRLNEVASWPDEGVIQHRGLPLYMSLQQTVQDLMRMSQSLTLFSRIEMLQESKFLSNQEFLNHLNELTREKAIVHRVSLDYQTDQSSELIRLSAGSALFALVALVHKGIESATDQDASWVKLSLQWTPEELQIRISDSGPSLSREERQAIHEQTMTHSTWDVNLRLCLQFLASIGGNLTLDRFSPDTCYLVRIPHSALAKQEAKAA